MNLKVLTFLTLISFLILGACAPSLMGSDSSASYSLTYIGDDGNVWALPSAGQQPKQITSDATGFNSGMGNPSVAYYFPQISGDGQWIAYRRNAGTPVETGMQYVDELWVYDPKTGKGERILDQIPASFTWKPGTHLLAYVQGVPDNYFMTNPPDASLTTSVMGYDADTGKTRELFKPERGYATYALQWSPDGRYLGFDELVYTEGRGPFGYYDFETGKYIAWEEPVGNYAWHPTNDRLYYDRAIYVPTGEEDIFFRSLEGGDEQRLTDFHDSLEYAFWPAISPGGEQIAFLANQDGLDSQMYTLLVQDLTGGEAIPLGEFESVHNLSWSPDGSQVLFSAGPWDAQKITAVNVGDKTAQVLADGTMPDFADGIKQ